MLLDLFLLGLVINLEPIPVTALIVLLAAERGVVKGAGFVVGWMLTLVVIVALTVAVTGGQPLIAHSSPSTVALALKLTCGVVLVVVAYRRRDRWRPSTVAVAARQPKWMAHVDRVNPLAAAGVAFVVQPWVLVTAGVATVTQLQLNNALEYVAVFGFCLWSTASYLAMEIYAVVRPDTVKARLGALLEWINQHRDQAVVVLSLTLGLYLMGTSIFGLVSNS